MPWLSRGLLALSLLATLPSLAAEKGASSSPQQQIRIQRSHSYSRAEARARLQLLLDYWSKAFGIREHWRGDTAWISGNVRGIRIQAEVTVGEHAVTGVLSDPGMLFRGMATDYVEQKLRKYLHPTYQDS